MPLAILRGEARVDVKEYKGLSTQKTRVELPSQRLWTQDVVEESGSVSNSMIVDSVINIFPLCKPRSAEICGT